MRMIKLTQHIQDRKEACASRVMLLTIAPGDLIAEVNVTDGAYRHGARSTLYRAGIGEGGYSFRETPEEILALIAEAHPEYQAKMVMPTSIAAEWKGPMVWPNVRPDDITATFLALKRQDGSAKLLRSYTGPEDHQPLRGVVEHVLDTIGLESLLKEAASDE